MQGILHTEFGGDRVALSLCSWHFGKGLSKESSEPSGDLFRFAHVHSNMWPALIIKLLTRKVYHLLSALEVHCQNNNLSVCLPAGTYPDGVGYLPIQGAQHE